MARDEPLKRLEDRRLLTTGGTYVADVDDPRLAGAAVAQFVRSDVAHGELRSIAADAALRMPGVVAVFTADDVDIGPMPPVLPRFPPELSAPLLATERVRYAGEPVAMVVADTATHAVDAAEAVLVDIEPLVPVTEPAASTACASELRAGSDEHAFDSCELVIDLDLQQPRIAACPLEARAAASAWEDGRLHHWVSTQSPHGVKRVLAAVFGIEEAGIRVVAPDVGGGFGPKFSNFPEDVMVAWAARRLGRAVRWVESRRESMIGLHHGRAQRQHVRLGGSRHGDLQVYAIEILQDAGAYASLGAYAPDATVRMTTGVYAIPSASASARAMLTNTTPVSAYRGTGRPEATCAIERAVDAFAREAGVDPVDLRLRNLIPASAFPFETPVGTVYDSGDYETVVRAACAAVRYDECRAEQLARREAGAPKQLGIGVCAYVESTAAGPGMEFATVTVDAGGSATVASGSSPHGQGHATTWTQLVHERLGIPVEQIRVVHGDTDAVPAGLGTFASRSVQLGGSAIVNASEQLIARGIESSADLLEADPGDITFDRSRGCFHVVGAPSRCVTWAEVAQATTEEALTEHTMFMGAMTFPFGAHIAVVEVDTETGDVRLVRHVAVDDAGTLVNPVIAEGQIHGGIAQAAGEALFEEFRYDELGTPLTTTFVDYAIPSAAELPSFEVAITETPAPSNPLGAKGVGESGVIGALAAIQNAACDAVAHLGVPHLDIPLTPQRVWRALQTART